MTRLDARMNGNGTTFSFVEPGSVACYARVQQQLPAEASSYLFEFVSASGDPDQAVLQLETLLQRHPTEAATAFESSAQALHCCIALFGASQWLGQTLLQNPDLLQFFAQPSGLMSPRFAEDYGELFARFRMRSLEVSLPVLLARFKRREYVRIFTRELMGLASLAETTAEISALSDVLIDVALMHCSSELRRVHKGWPQLLSEQGRVYPARFSVLALGKLGGNELNYSSDIDLLYLCDDAEDARTIDISAREFFTRLAQNLTAVLSCVSTEGHVFRVDLRLRPQGTSGEMVTGYAQAIRYYQSVAHDWELQALLKLRPSAGHRTLAREFVAQVQELIYCKELSLSAIQTAAHSLEKIQRGIVHRGEGELDVKIGPGGLREIEFVVQCLQRVYGGTESWLRSSGTLFALQKLHDKGHIGAAEFRELCDTYALLRAIEHRLQCYRGVPSHRLPADAREQAALFRSLGLSLPRDAAELRRVMASANKLCAMVLQLGTGGAPSELTALSVGLGSTGTELLTRELSNCSAPLAKAFAKPGDLTARNLQRFLAAASTEPTCSSLITENVEWIEKALPVFGNSALATGILARHPEDLIALFRECPPDEDKSISDQLRILWRRCLLLSVGRTLLERTPVWQVLRELSRHFDLVLQQAFAFADPPADFAVLAVGRLGTCELDAVSDADLVFVRGTGCSAEDAQKCALSLVATLSGYTREGSVIAVDTRLRPHGNEGELVASSRQLAQYFENDAKAWETLAFGKLRLIAGEERLAQEATQALSVLRERFATNPVFVSELIAMRKRIADSGGAGSFKTSAGGLYDLDFLIGMLEARGDLPSAGRQAVERLQGLAERGLISTRHCEELLSAVNLFRSADHAVRVVEGRSRKWLPESDVLHTSVEEIVGITDLDSALRAQMVSVRSIFDYYFRN